MMANVTNMPMRTTSRNVAGADGANQSKTTNETKQMGKTNKLESATTLSNTVIRDQSELFWLLVSIWVLRLGIVSGVMLLFCWDLYLSICVLYVTIAVASAIEPIRKRIDRKST